jgi:hypothetical protein
MILARTRGDGTRGTALSHVTEHATFLSLIEGVQQLPRQAMTATSTGKRGNWVGAQGFAVDGVGDALSVGPPGVGVRWGLGAWMTPLQLIL